MAGRKTRQKPPNIIVTEEDLPATDLPTLKDVLAKMKLEKERNNAEIKQVAEKVLPEIKAIYRKVNSNLVINNDRTIIAKLINEFKQMKDLERSKVKGKKKDNFEIKMGKLFDIILCKCKISTCEDHPECEGCEVQAHSLCQCKDGDKIPDVELLYVLDQRSRHGGARGRFQIGAKDIKSIENMEKASLEAHEAFEKKKKQKAALEEAKEREAQRLINEKPLINVDLTEALFDAGVIDMNEKACDIFEDSSSDDDFNETNNNLNKSSHQNRMGLRNLAMICDRYGVSSRAGAAIANAALVDAAVINIDDQTHVIDKNKLRRAIEKFREERTEEDSKELLEAQGDAFYFDGKKDVTLFVKKDDYGKMYNTYEEEEHISVSSEPGGKYVTHLTPAGGKGSEISEVVVDYLTKHGVIDSWKIIGGDSTAVNTAVDRGCFVLTEAALGRRLFRVVCTLHLNELPFRHVFTQIDGPTDSKNTFKGNIGKLLPKVEELDFNPRFKKISEGPGLPYISESVANDLSSDQRLLLLVFESVHTGMIRKELYSLTPGPVSHSRWLTHACRCCLLYMKKHGLSRKDKDNLNIIVRFLMISYIPMWFRLKQKPSIEEGSRHFFKQIETSRILPKQTQPIARANLVRNAYWAHPESLLLSMLTDAEGTVRTKAVEIILGLRGGQDLGDNSPRRFIIPEVIFESLTYTEMIDWNKEAL